MSAFRARDNVIECELGRSVDAPAVLARIVVPEEDVLSREALSLKRNVNILRQSNDRRKRHCCPSRMNKAIVAFLSTRDTLKDQHDCPSRRANVDWLIGRVEYKYPRIHS